VTVVGILAADVSLGANDFRSGERTFQLLTQCAGRAGRGDTPGRVVIQTYNPQHYSVRLAARQNYELFYENEMRFRRLMKYPPCGHMLAVLIQDSEEAFASGMAQRFVSRAFEFCGQTVKSNSDRDEQAEKTSVNSQRPSLDTVQILGPAVASIGKICDRYRFVIYFKSRSYSHLVMIKDLLETIPADTSEVNFDFEPVHFGAL